MQKKFTLESIVWILLLWLSFAFSSVHAEETVCAVVKIEINQELTLERQAFDATMRINNGLDNLSLENVAINVTFEDEDGVAVLATSDPNNTDASFYIRIDSMDGITDISGAGVVHPLTTAEIHWLIIPAPGAGGTVPSGKLYFVGASLDYTLGGEPENTTVTPDSIYVKPLPLLTLDYFLTRDVFADDAFTPEVEPAEPFTLGVRVQNNGAATATNVNIDSAQPKIIENEQGLLIGFTIIGSHVNDQPTTNSLLINLGNVDPNAASIGRWDMLTTLSGKFTEFDASFSHADELGGALTSILEATNPYFLVHNVRVDLPGRDNILDFLAYPPGGTGDALTVYESDNVDTEVTNQSANTTLTAVDSGATVTYTLSMPVTTGLVYAKLRDPYGGTKEFKQVVRSDGKYMPEENVWTSKTRNLSTEPPSWDYWVNFFDANTTGTYAAVMGPPALGPTPPSFTPLNNVTTWETNPISVAVSAIDPNGDTVTLEATALPPGATFNDNNNGSGILSWTPAVGQAGDYVISFKATDNGGLSSITTMAVKVNPEWDTDGDGLDDQWELDNFGDLSRDGSGDFDGDGISDLQEYLDGTDPTVAAITGEWGAPSYVETDNTGDASNPAIAIASDGSALAVWQQSDGTRTNIWANQYVPGTGWSTPVLLESDDTGDAHDPRVAIDANGNAVAVWLQGDGSRANLWSAYYQSATGWETAVLVENIDSGDADDAQIVMTADGEAVVLWAQADGTLDANGVAQPNTIWSNRFVPATSWETAVRIEADTNIHALGTQLAVDADGNLLALWSSSADGSTYNIAVNQFVVDSVWQTPQVLRAGAFGDTTTPEVTAQLAMNGNGDAVVAWAEAASPTSVWAMTYTTSGGWSTAEEIEAGTTSAIQPAVAIDKNGNAIAVFAQSDDTRYSIRANRYSTGSGWGGAELIGTSSTSPVNGDAAAPQVAIDIAGNTTVVWQQTDGIQLNIWTTRYSHTDLTWDAAQIIDTENDGDAVAPQLALERNGSAVVVWSQSDGTQSNLQANTYEESNTGVPNITPIAVVGDDVTVDEQASVALDATGSFDQDGSLDTYSWVQTAGTTVNLLAANTATPSFTSPELTAQDVLTFQLTLADTEGASAVSDVNVTVNPVNAPPTASAGTDITSDEQITVSLSGSGTDTDGTIDSYAWTQLTGIPVALLNADSANASFVAPVVLVQDSPQVLTFELTVTDNEDGTATDEVSVTVNGVNAAPGVNAGIDKVVNEQTTVTLNGSSSDADGFVTRHEWTQVDGITVSLLDANSATASFVAPTVLVQDGPQVLNFRLTVFDNENGVTSDDITVTVNAVNAPPTVDAGGNRAINEQTPVTLNGSATDPDGSIVTYSWSQRAGTTVSMTGGDTATPSFTTPVVLRQDSPSVLTFRLTVTDNEGASVSSDVNIGVMAVNALPVADAAADKIVDEQLAVTLAGSGTDTDGTIKSYVWSQVSGTVVTLNNANTASADFIAPTLKTSAILTFRLTVTDNEDDSASDEMQVTVNPVNTPPIANAGDPQTADEYTTVTLDASTSTDPDADGIIIGYNWVQTDGPSVAFDGAAVQPSFTAPAVYQNTTLSFSLTVTDDEGGVDTAATSVVLVSVNPDDDADGLLDLWEIRYFGNMDRDGSEDYDNDGATDAEEHGYDTDPTVAQMPTDPEIVSPDGTEVTTLQPQLVLSNPDQHPGFPVTYQYEVYRDATMSDLVTSVQDVGLNWQVDVPLDDNTWYYWRARAANQVLSSEWVSSRFFVNTVNDNPGAFNLSYPQDGVWVPSFTPELSVTNSVDVDEDALTYRFEVYAGSVLTRAPVAVGDNIPPGLNGTTAWSVTETLIENRWYSWHVIVTDEHGASTQSPTGMFFVNTVNDAPGVPVVNSPTDGSEIITLYTTLAVDNVIEPEDEPVEYLFELDTLNTFDSSNKQVSGAIPEGATITEWPVLGLMDNTWYHWRAKASDGRAESAWVLASFFVNQFNDAPGIPQPMNPGELSWVGSLTPTLEVYPAVDVDGDTLRYEFELSDADKRGNMNMLVASGGSDTTYWQVPQALEDSGWYYWRARAIDEHGLAGEWSAWIQFYADEDGVNDAPKIRLKDIKYKGGNKNALNKLEKRYRKDDDDEDDDHKDKYKDLQQVEIRWKDRDPDSNARISLYYDTDKYGQDGVLIADDIFEDPDGKADKYQWDVSQMAPGIYYVYVTIDDGTSSSTEYARKPIVIGDGGGWPFLMLNMDREDDHKWKRHRIVTLKWQDIDTDSNAMISLYYDTDNQGFDGTLLAAGIEEDPDGKADKYKWDVSMLAEDKDYYVYAVISDENRDYRVYTDKPFHIHTNKWPYHNDDENDDKDEKKDKDKDKDKEKDKEKDDKSVKDKVCKYVSFLCK